MNTLLQQRLLHCRSEVGTQLPLPGRRSWGSQSLSHKSAYLPLKPERATELINRVPKKALLEKSKDQAKLTKKLCATREHILRRGCRAKLANVVDTPGGMLDRTPLASVLFYAANTCSFHRAKHEAPINAHTHIRGFPQKTSTTKARSLSLSPCDQKKTLVCCQQL